MSIQKIGLTMASFPFRPFCQLPCSYIFSVSPLSRVFHSLCNLVPNYMFVSIKGHTLIFPNLRNIYSEEDYTDLLLFVCMCVHVCTCVPYVYYLWRQEIHGRYSSQLISTYLGGLGSFTELGAHLFGESG